MEHLNVEKLRVGDEVGIGGGAAWEPMYIGRVTRVLATQIEVEFRRGMGAGTRTMKFNKRGIEVGGDRWHANCLVSVEQAVEYNREQKERRAHDRRADEVRRAVELLKHDVEAVRRLHALATGLVLDGTKPSRRRRSRRGS